MTSEHDIPDWNAKRAAIRSVVDLIAEREPHFRSAETYVQRQLAVAYLLRCRRLLLGMEELRQQELRDVQDVLLRPFFEAWLYGMWVLLGDPEVVDTLRSAYMADVAKLDRMAGLGLEEIEDWGNERFGPPVEQVAVIVGKLLAERADEDAKRNLLWSYQLVYRSESGRNIHGGLAQVFGHLVQGPGWLAARTTRTEAGDGSGTLLWTGYLLALFARHTLEAFGIAVAPLDAATRPLDAGDVQAAAD